MEKEVRQRSWWQAEVLPTPACLSLELTPPPWRARSLRWFVLKQGKLFWFKSDVVTPDSVPRGVIEVGLFPPSPPPSHGSPPLGGSELQQLGHCGNTTATDRQQRSPLPLPSRLPPPPQVSKCLSIKGAEDSLNKPHAFELSSPDSSMFFIADSDKEKEDWINAVGRAIVKHSRRWVREGALRRRAGRGAERGAQPRLPSQGHCGWWSRGQAG